MNTEEYINSLTGKELAEYTDSLIALADEKIDTITTFKLLIENRAKEGLSNGDVVNIEQLIETEEKLLLGFEDEFGMILVRCQTNDSDPLGRFYPLIGLLINIASTAVVIYIIYQLVKLF